MEQIQSLPQELQNIVLEHYFSLGNAKSVPVDGSYKPPIQLQINRATRQAFAREYYSGSTFTFNERSVIFLWLKSLTAEHHDYIKTLHYDTLSQARIRTRDLAIRNVIKLVATVVVDFERLCLELIGSGLPLFNESNPPDIHFGLRFEGQDEVVWTSHPRHVLYSAAGLYY